MTIQRYDNIVPAGPRKNGFMWGARSRKILRQIHPDLCRVCLMALDRADMDFGAHCGLRSMADQKRLVKMGKSRTLNSRHLTGHAVDLHPWVRGEIPWNDWGLWVTLSNQVQAAAKKIGVPIEWGGDWARFTDCPHFQLPWKEYPAPESN